MWSVYKIVLVASQNFTPVPWPSARNKVMLAGILTSGWWASRRGGKHDQTTA